MIYFYNCVLSTRRVRVCIFPKHSFSNSLNSNHSTPASGTLMGIEEDSGLQVTSCFGYKRADPSAYGEQADMMGAKQSFQYEVDMIKLLGDVNLDAQSVGWYMTTHHGNLFNEALVEHQYVFQSQVPTAVCVVYDSFKTQVGNSGFTAYRLTQEVSI